jgi:hypothetical protein
MKDFAGKTPSAVITLKTGKTCRGAVSGPDLPCSPTRRKLETIS